MTDDLLQVSITNRVLRHRLEARDVAIANLTERARRIERGRELATVQMQVYREQLDDYQKKLIEEVNRRSDVEDRLARLQYQTAKHGTAEWAIMIERETNGRCPMCGSDDLIPADYMRTEDGDEHGWGIHCIDCGFDRAGLVHSYAVFIHPGKFGSHDSMPDYDAVVGSKPFVLMEDEE